MKKEARFTSAPQCSLSLSQVFCSTASFEEFAATLHEPALALTIPDATHFDVVSHVPGALLKWLRRDFDAEFETFARGEFPRFKTISPTTPT